MVFIFYISILQFNNITIFILEIININLFIQKINLYLVIMPELDWKRCPKHKKNMKKDFDKYGTPFWYCPICGYYRYFDGRRGTDPSLIEQRQPPRQIQDSEGPLCPQCRMEHMILHSSGWLCPRCGHRR